MEMFRDEMAQARKATEELVELAGLRAGDIFVVGCSTSEVRGENIGKGGSLDLAKALFEGIYPVLHERGIYLAAQCCEHLNRALIIEREAALRYGYDVVNVCPWEHAGGSFATATWSGLNEPCAVEHIRARAGMDIGDTLIGMHLKEVAVPVRLSLRQIGHANLVGARSRPTFVGGERARYNDALK